MQTAIMLGANPCAMSIYGRLAYRVYQGIDFISDGVGAYNDVMAGNYLSAGLRILSVVANLSSMAKACFTGDMQVITRRGWVRWDELRNDDEVLACDEFNPQGPLDYKRIEETYVTHARITSAIIIRT